MGRLKKNILYNILYQVSVIIIPLITAPYISRVIGAEGVGIYSYSTSVASYFALFILWGVGNYGVRTIAKSRDNHELCQKKFWSIYSFQIICTIIVLLIYSIFIYFTESKYQLALVIQILYLLSVGLDVNWYFAGTEQFRITVTRGMIVKFLQVALIFVLIHAETDVYKYIAIMTGGTLVGQICLFPIIFKQIPPVKVTIKEIKSHIKPNIILFIPILATSVFTIMDKIMLEWINHDIAAVGIYEYSEKIVKLPLGVITAIGTVMLPKISNLLANDNEKESQRYFQISMHYIGILVTAMAFGIASIAPTFAIVFYGKGFEECGVIITMLSIILVTSSWANIIRTQYLIPNSKEKTYIIAVVCGAALNLLLNGIFIPIMGAKGAAIGTIGAELILCIIHTVGVWKDLELKKSLKDWALYCLCAFIMFIAVRLVSIFVNVSVVGLCIEILVGIVTFAILIFMILFVKKDVILDGIVKKIKH